MVLTVEQGSDLVSVVPIFSAPHRISHAVFGVFSVSSSTGPVGISSGRIVSGLPIGIGIGIVSMTALVFS
jgi:hypothetical protein